MKPPPQRTRTPKRTGSPPLLPRAPVRLLRAPVLLPLDRRPPSRSPTGGDLPPLRIRRRPPPPRRIRRPPPPPRRISGGDRAGGRPAPVAGLPRGTAFPCLRELSHCSVAIGRRDIHAVLARSPVLEVLPRLRHPASSRAGAVLLPPARAKPRQLPWGKRVEAQRPLSRTLAVEVHCSNLLLRVLVTVPRCSVPHAMVAVACAITSRAADSQAKELAFFFFFFFSFIVLVFLFVYSFFGRRRRIRASRCQPRDRTRAAGVRGSGRSHSSSALSAQESYEVGEDLLQESVASKRTPDWQHLRQQIERHVFGEDLPRARGTSEREDSKFPTLRLDQHTSPYRVYSSEEMVRIFELEKEKEAVTRRWLNPSDPGKIQLYLHEKKLISFMLKINAVDTPSLLAISGTAGVGKTNLLRALRNKYKSFFHYVFFAGAACGVDLLQHVIFINLGLSPLPQTSDVPIAKIISSFLKEESFLLLLDDLRETLDLAAVGLPMSLGHRQKVIFTTRSQAICDFMGCGINTIHLQCLEEEDAWSLFRDKVGDEIIHAHPQIKHLAKKIVVECGGLPSTLCTVGRAMSSKRDVKEWRNAYDLLKMKRPPPSEIQGPNEIQEIGDDRYILENALRTT